MKRLALGAVALVMAGCVFAWFALPAQTATILLWINAQTAGLEAKVVQTQAGEIHYLEGGPVSAPDGTELQTIVLVHGIYARKEHWIELSRALTQQYRVIALDLPGFGDNALQSDDAYLLSRQRDALEQVLDGLGVRAAHVGANSMGAYVSVLLAQTRPDLFASLAFIGSPLGVPTPQPSDMDRALAEGHFPLVVQSDADFDARNGWLSPNMPYLPGPVLRLWRAEEVAQGPKNQRIWDAVHQRSDVPNVLTLAPQLTMDTLVIWCRPDRIFHVSGAQVLDHALPRNRLAVLDGCGHLPMLDSTHAVAHAYTEFLQGIARTRKD